MTKADKFCGLKYEPGSFERYMRNQIRKRKNIEDQKILDQMMADLKKKNETQKQQQIDELTSKLEKARG